jgi:monoamine oxidase
MNDGPVIVVGAGIAGLAAADALSTEGISVTVLEARERIGGRIHTAATEGGTVPIEIGAEFVHGARNETWRLIRAAALATHEVPDSHWISMKGVLVRDPDFWDQLSKATEDIDCSLPDQDFASYLAGQHELDNLSRWLASEYVEGFHAAPADMMSIHALKKADQRAEQEEGTRQFRLSRGYSQMADWFAARVNSHGSIILRGQNVRVVKWRRGRVEVIAQTGEGLQKHEGVAAVITVPLGVLKAEPEEGIFFEPELPGKRIPIRSLQMGPVIKVTLCFLRRFWPIENFGFIHSHEELFPVWWSDERGPILTGWTGAGRATWLCREDRESIIAEAVGSLARIFKLDSAFLKDRLEASFYHDWISDPFSRGAYSFTPTGMTSMPETLAEPVSSALFFAGEATDSKGNQGTVQGALMSGERAAGEVLRMFRAKERMAARSLSGRRLRL